MADGRETRLMAKVPVMVDDLDVAMITRSQRSVHEASVLSAHAPDSLNLVIDPKSQFRPDRVIVDRASHGDNILI